jgi:Trp operon repressor
VHVTSYNEDEEWEKFVEIVRKAVKPKDKQFSARARH